METESFTFFRRMDMLLLVAYATWPQLGGPRRATWGGVFLNVYLLELSKQGHYQILAADILHLALNE